MCSRVNHNLRLRFAPDFSAIQILVDDQNSDRKNESNDLFLTMLYINVLLPNKVQLIYADKSLLGTGSTIGGMPVIDDDDADFKSQLSKNELKVLLDEEDHKARDTINKKREIDEENVSTQRLSQYFQGNMEK